MKPRAYDATPRPFMVGEACGADVTFCGAPHALAPLPPLACGCSPLHTSSPLCHRCSCLECVRVLRKFRARLRQLGPVQLRLWL